MNSSALLIQNSPQAIPARGLLAENLNLTLPELAKRVCKAEGAAYSYVVRSIKMDTSGEHFEHYGSGPNFQGGLLTLCTCKHQMRTSLDCGGWAGTWVAGFTSRSLHERRHWLFYLTRVRRATDSHAELWDSLPAGVREKKSAKANFLGDLFAPRGKVAGDGRFDPRRYYTPARHSHRRNACDNGWHNDVNYWCAGRNGRRPALLVGDQQLTFIWEAPIIRFDDKHCRNFKKWESIDSLVRRLE
jgi:hypothetical protein